MGEATQAFDVLIALARTADEPKQPFVSDWKYLGAERRETYRRVRFFIMPGTTPAG